MKMKITLFYKEETLGRMDLVELFNYILYIILTVILPVVTVHVVNFIKAKIRECTVIEEATKNEVFGTLIQEALSDVMDTVLYVNQVYTDSLKANGKFDMKAQEEAFNLAYNEARNIITVDAQKAIKEIYGSFENWLKLKIESSVNIAKKQ